MVKLSKELVLVLFIQQLVLVIHSTSHLATAQSTTDPETATEQPPATGDEELTDKSTPTTEPPPLPPPPSPIATASYLSLDGLTLVIMFDKPVELNGSSNNDNHSGLQSSKLIRLEPAFGRLVASRWPTCLASPKDQQPAPDQQNSREIMADSPIQGIQMCAKLLTKKTLKLLHKYKLHNCIWPTRTQLLIQIARPAPIGSIRVVFQRNSLREFRASGDDGVGAASNGREISLELQRLPLEALGVPLAPRLALTGPNQVPPCGQFSLSAHLSSPYGTRAGDSVRLSWSVERVGFGPVPAGNGSQLLRASSQQQAASELQWTALRELVSANKANNLLLDSRLLQPSPQRYEFLVTATFATSMATISLNASHQVSRLDFEAPIGTVYGSHMLAQQAYTNPSQELFLLADIQVPECATSVKQVGLYWQVSEPRVRFEQTYSPFYLARPNSLPEQSTIEFRLNVFYGIRVKKYSSSGSLVTTGDSMLEAQISGGALVIAIGRGEDDSSNLDGGSQLDSSGQHQLELVAGNGDASSGGNSDLFTYQWSCFDGKTAQPCARYSKTAAATATATGTFPQQQFPAPTTNSTPRYEIGSLTNGLDGLRPASAQALSSLPLIEPKRQRQQVLRLAKGWLQPEAQLWFGLQRFDRQNPSHKSQSEYTLVSVHQGSSPTLIIGPVLVGRSRHRATVRNPLTGAVVLMAGAPAVVVGRISGGGPWPAEQSFAWRLVNQVASPLKWSVRNTTNPANGQQELISELHLSQRLLVAHAHYQLQLVACNSAGQTVAATLSLDVVSGVSQCRVGAGLSPESLGHALVVAVEHCNIPLGLSPLTYQLYMVESMDKPQLAAAEGSAGAEFADEDEDPDYVSDVEQMALLARSQPLTSPQLSPVFSLAGFGPNQLAALIGIGDDQMRRSNVSGGALPTSGEPAANKRARARALRYGARVCDQLKSCRVFFSATFGPQQLLAAGGGNSNQQPPIAASEPTQRGPQMVKSLGAMIDGARRANLAGNSIAAIAILDSVVNMGQKLINGAKQQRDSSGASSFGNNNNIEDRLRDIVQVAARDSLNYGTQSIQRQFHYTESGQTNLVMHSMGRILTLPHGNIELKFRAIRLITQLTQRTIGEQLNLKVSCLADFKSIQWVFETLFGTFSHYSMERSATLIDKSHSSYHHHHHHNNKLNTNHNNRSPPQISLSKSNSSTTTVPIMRQPQSANLQQPFLATTTSAPTPISTRNSNNNNNNNKTNSANRKRREEAILAYLRSVRLAHRALISAAAIQLPLGDAQHFHYSSGGSIGGSESNNMNHISRSRSTSQQQQLTPATEATTPIQSATTDPMQPSSSPISSFANSATSNSARATTTTSSSSSDIVSSLTHLTEITDLPIPIELPPGFGSISLQLDRRFSQRLRQLIEGDKLICRNDTGGKCSTFVLAITWFAGKAPFRSLDETKPGGGGGSLKVPVLEIGLLSPLDGSNLMELIDWGDETGGGSDHELSSSVTFVVPTLTDLDGSEQQQQSANKYKCYKFDEDANEWAQIQQVAVEPLEVNSQGGGLNPPIELIRCRFRGLGAIGVFKGRPSAGENSVGHSVALFILGAVGIVLVLSLISCLASSSRSDSDSDRSSDIQDTDSGRNLGKRRHPEETTSYRNDFNYPL